MKIDGKQILLIIGLNLINNEIFKKIKSVIRIWKFNILDEYNKNKLVIY